MWSNVMWSCRRTRDLRQEVHYEESGRSNVDVYCVANR